MTFRIINADVLEALRGLPDNTFDGVLCDPPYELGFMGKSWDASGVAFHVATWKEVLRVCKPGAHILAFGGTRTYHRLACAIEDAGWEIRDCLQWVYGSGFPKSLDVSKALDKSAGAERRVVGVKNIGNGNGRGEGFNHPGGQEGVALTAPATDVARTWEGYGTALKPAYEPCLLARKPLDGTVAANVQKWGCGALWIDGGRIGTDVVSTHSRGSNEAFPKRPGEKTVGESGRIKDQREGLDHSPRIGRWPANIIHDGSPEVLAGFPESKSPGRFPSNTGGIGGKNGIYGGAPGRSQDERETDLGSAARFFYCAKASQKERNAGCGGLPVQYLAQGNQAKAVRNIHPTVKPLDLCRYLATLILPARPHGPRKLLTPFSGSGSEMIGALMAGWEDVTGIEKDTEHGYVEIAEARLAHWTNALQEFAPDSCKKPCGPCVVTKQAQLPLLGVGI